MEVSGILSAIVIGLVLGALGRLVVRGRQNIPLWMTVLVGIAAALLGTFVASGLGVDETKGVDWIELFLQIGIAAIGVSTVSSIRTGRRRRASLTGRRSRLGIR